MHQKWSIINPSLLLTCMPFQCRFGSGYTLQFKVSNSAIAEPVKSSLQTVSMGISVPLRSLEFVDTTRVKQFVAETFPGAVLTEEHQVCVFVCVCVCRDCCEFRLFLAREWLSSPEMQGSVTYQIGSGVSWSHMFRCIETNKHRFGIVDYSINQTTLEQVRAQWLHVHAKIQ